MSLLPDVVYFQHGVIWSEVLVLAGGLLGEHEVPFPFGRGLDWWQVLVDRVVIGNSPNFCNWVIEERGSTKGGSNG